MTLDVGELVVTECWWLVGCDVGSEKLAACCGDGCRHFQPGVASKRVVVRRWICLG